ncbi:MAG: hypothetical protein IPM48_11595 [Saprospiraceae bacterium]|nr:hypothetical protein [Saprospiraceae bacterium]
MICASLLFYLQISLSQIQLNDSLPLGDAKVMAFPSTHFESNNYRSDEPFVFYYNYQLENNIHLKDKSDFAVLIRVESNEGNTYRSSNLLTIQDAKEFYMTEVRPGLYRYSFVPNIVFRDILPQNQRMTKMEITILAIPYCGNSSCHVDGKFVYSFPCR